MITLIKEDSFEGLRLYRYDDIRYNKGDQIKPPPRKYDRDVIKFYRESTGIEDVTSVVYLLENQNDEYLEVYQYEYLVKATGVVFKGVMDYSPELCNYEKSRIVSLFGYSLWENFVKLMSAAYAGDLKSMNSLKKYYDYEISSDKYEYISTGAEVVMML